MLFLHLNFVFIRFISNFEIRKAFVLLKAGFKKISVTKTNHCLKGVSIFIGS